jgi:hypothetical protein
MAAGVNRRAQDFPADFGLGVGAGDRDRTDDIQLGKLTFYH